MLTMTSVARYRSLLESDLRGPISFQATLPSPWFTSIPRALSVGNDAQEFHLSSSKRQHTTFSYAIRYYTLNKILTHDTTLSPPDLFLPTYLPTYPLTRQHSNPARHKQASNTPAANKEERQRYSMYRHGTAQHNGLQTRKIPANPDIPYPRNYCRDVVDSGVMVLTCILESHSMIGLPMEACYQGIYFDGGSMVPICLRSSQGLVQAERAIQDDYCKG